MAPISTLPSVYSKIYTPIALGITIIFLVLISRSVFADYVASSAQVSALETKAKEKENELKILSDLQAQFSDSKVESALKKKISRYNKTFNEADIMEMMMVKPPQLRANTDGTYNLMVSAFGVDKGKKLPNGLSLASVNISLQARDVDTLVDYITYLTNQDSETAFTIDSITLPIDTNPDETKSIGGINMSLSLGMYYYQ